MHFYNKYINQHTCVGRVLFQTNVVPRRHTNRWRAELISIEIRNIFIDFTRKGSLQKKWVDKKFRTREILHTYVINFPMCWIFRELQRKLSFTVVCRAIAEENTYISIRRKWTSAKVQI
jgi:hypothetical protein